MKKHMLFWKLFLVCITLLLIVFTGIVAGTTSRYASAVSKRATFDMYVNPQSSSAMNVSSVTIKLHNNEDGSHSATNDILGKIVAFTNATETPHILNCPNIVPPTRDGYVFEGYYGYVGDTPTLVFDKTGTLLVTEVFDDVYAKWSVIVTTQ